MIAGIGIDIIEIERFKDWHTYSEKRLKKVFSDQEIAYCLQEIQTSAERFAVRFAAKEAFLKAWTQATNQSVPFLVLCKHVSITSKNGAPCISLDNAFITPEHYREKFKYHISLSHNRTQAAAYLIIVQA